MLRSTFSSLREYLTPVSHKSSFQTTGQITPEEFVQAGDYLVYRFPTWSWAPASKSKRRDFLPAEKQYLVTHHIPCYERATQECDSALELLRESGAGNDGAPGDDDAWLVSRPKDTELAQLTSAPTEMVDSLDLDDLEALGIEEDGASGPATPSTARQARSYNVYITYSTSYRVPKAYLSGFDADGTPLPPKLMFDDIVGDYKDKTVTIESAPFQDSLTLISIHPCRHAGVMRMLLDMANARAIAEAKNEEDVNEQSAKNKHVDDPANEDTEEAEWEEVPQGLRVDQYLVVFLKFIASVTPTIQYDFTMSAL